VSEYRNCDGLRFELGEGGILHVVFDGPGLNAVSVEGHRRLATIWSEIDADPDVRVVLVRGEGNAFSAGGHFAMLEQLTLDETYRTQCMNEAGAIVRNILGFSKPIVSAIHGVAVGAGLAVGLLADVSVVGRRARIVDGHTRIGVAAGDHAVACWPLLLGMAKAKYYLLTCEPMSGEEAERIGLVSLCVDDDAVLTRAEEIAASLAQGSAAAIAATKRTLNGWYDVFRPAFEASLALEFYGFGTSDAAEGLRAVKERRAPSFQGALG
jgi:enoyl-CoA hydratase